MKWWSVLFGVVNLACLLSLVVSPFLGWWLPQNVASFGPDVDWLFYLILILTGFFFVLTEVLLVWFMWRYAGDPSRKAVYVEGNTALELVWSAIPGVLLLFIAFAQIPAWMKMKFVSHMPKAPDQVLQVTARQWEWRMRYPGDPNQLIPLNDRSWADSPHYNDVNVVNEIHTWKGARVKIFLKTQDVLHSLFLPNLRLKQDTLPGRTLPMWFEPTEWNTDFDPNSGKWFIKPNMDWEIACAELCGGRHYAMRGLLYVHADREDYLKWLASRVADQHRDKARIEPNNPR